MAKPRVNQTTWEEIKKQSHIVHFLLWWLSTLISELTGQSQKLFILVRIPLNLSTHIMTAKKNELLASRLWLTLSALRWEVWGEECPDQSPLLYPQWKASRQHQLGLHLLAHPFSTRAWLFCSILSLWYTRGLKGVYGFCAHSSLFDVTVWVAGWSLTNWIKSVCCGHHWWR